MAGFETASSFSICEIAAEQVGRHDVVEDDLAFFPGVWLMTPVALGVWALIVWAVSELLR